MKALPIYVYENKSYGNCSNNGISERYNRLLLICDEGFVDVDESNPPENLVKIVTRELFGEVYKHIEPVAPVKPGNVGYMMGGAFAYSSDSRFSRISQQPLAIHDRQESQQMYDMMSR